MDDSQVHSSQLTVHSSDDANVQAPPVVQTPTQSSAPAGSVQKEAAPVAPVSEFIKPSETEPALHPEVAEAGVEAQRALDIDPEAKSLGIKVMHEATPVVTEPTGMVQLPMAEKESEHIAKHGDKSNSITWKALQIFRQCVRMDNR